MYWGATFNGDGCDRIMQLVQIDERGIDSSVEAEAAAAECFFNGQIGGACSEDVLDFGELLMGESDFGWTPMDLDYLTDPWNEVDIFYRAYHYLLIMDKGGTFARDGSGSDKRDGHDCGQCSRKILDSCHAMVAARTVSGITVCTAHGARLRGARHEWYIMCPQLL